MCKYDKIEDMAKQKKKVEYDNRKEGKGRI